MTIKRMNIALSLRAKGKNISEIARELKCARSTVYSLLSAKPPKTERSERRSPADKAANEHFLCVEDFEDLQDRSGLTLEQLWQHAGLNGEPRLDREITAVAVNKMLDLIATQLGERQVKYRRPLGTLNQRIRELWNTTHKGKPLSIAVRVGTDSKTVFEVLGLANPAEYVSTTANPGIHRGGKGA